MAWYQKTRRWCQTNLTEIDAQICDVSAWKRFWKEHHIDGVIVNAGGIVSYYPSEDPLQYRSPYLHQRDLLGEFVAAARECSLAVVARMDCNRADEKMYRAHADWFAVDAQGHPYQIDGRYIACVNGPYDQQFIPERLREIARIYAPDGFADNSWQGLPAQHICYCETCRAKFRKSTGEELPAHADWQDDLYRRWVQWSIECRMENWRLFNRVTQSFHPDCLWLGMVNADPVNAHCAMYDLHTLAQETPFLMVDHQNRDAVNGFEQNMYNGLLLHGLTSDSLEMAESMAHYSRGVYTFRRSAMPEHELRLWMLCGIAGGIRPWLHIVGAVQEDMRMLQMDREIMDWHWNNQDNLEGGQPIASIGLVWSQRNVIFYGQDQPDVRCGQPWRGFVHALVRARIPFLPLCAADIPRDTAHFHTLILPDLAVMTDDELSRLESFVQSGGHIVSTGATGMLNELGHLRTDHRMDRLLGIWRTKLPVESTRDGSWDTYGSHTYMRIEDKAHQVFASFEETAILPFGGWKQSIERQQDWMHTLATYIPAFPYYPPEFAYMRQPHTQTPLLLAGKNEYGGRILVLAADVDRRYGQAAIPDHGNLLASAVRWVHSAAPEYTVIGKGYIASVLYKRASGLLLHLINLSGANVWPGFAEETYPTEMLTIQISDQCGLTLSCAARSLVSQASFPLEKVEGGYRLYLSSLSDQECILFPFAD